MLKHYAWLHALLRGRYGVRLFMPGYILLAFPPYFFAWTPPYFLGASDPLRLASFYHALATSIYKAKGIYETTALRLYVQEGLGFR